VKAWLIEQHGGPETLHWTDVPTPDPGPEDVLVRVRACALNHLDLWVRNGVDGHRFPLPLIPGSEITGDVEACGSAVRDLEIGGRVLLAPGVSCGVCDACVAGSDNMCRHYGILGESRNGGYAERISVPRRNVLRLPENLDYIQGAALPLVFLTAWHMLVERAALRPLEDILIHAAGSGVSSAGIQISRLLGARHVIVTASSDEKLRKARALGATHTIDYTREDFVARVREITGRKGVDVVLDHVGGDVFEKSLSILTWSGRMVICGATSSPVATLPLRAVFFKSLSVLGSTMGSQAELREVLRHVELGRLQPVVDRVLPLQRAPEAQQILENREQFGKIVLEVRSDEAASETKGESA
jgi:NADPH:quinone reductase-like Zn-dependent oxidoreductase